LKRRCVLAQRGESMSVCWIEFKKPILLPRHVACRLLVIGAYGLHFAKTKELDPKFHRWLVDAFDVRVTGDYDVDESISAQIVATLINQARESSKPRGNIWESNDPLLPPPKGCFARGGVRRTMVVVLPTTKIGLESLIFVRPHFSLKRIDYEFCCFSKGRTGTIPENPFFFCFSYINILFLSWASS